MLAQYRSHGTGQQHGTGLAGLSHATSSAWYRCFPVPGTMEQEEEGPIEGNPPPLLQVPGTG